MMICSICGQTVKIRKRSALGHFPVQHNRPNSNQPCHGFYEHGRETEKEVLQ